MVCMMNSPFFSNGRIFATGSRAFRPRPYKAHPPADVCKIAAIGAPSSSGIISIVGESHRRLRAPILPAMKPFHVEAQAASVILPISRRSSLFRSVPQAAGTQILPSYDGGARIFFIILRHDDACK